MAKTPLSYLGWYFEFLHHIELKEATDAHPNEVKLSHWQVTEVELQYVTIFSLWDVGPLCK